MHTRQSHVRRFLACAGSRFFLLAIARSCPALTMRSLILGLRDSHRDCFFGCCSSEEDGSVKMSTLIRRPFGTGRKAWTETTRSRSTLQHSSVIV